MKILFKIILSLFLVLASNSYANQEKTQENSVKQQNIIPFYSKESRKRLIESKYNNDFYQLVNFYQPQINPLYCGIATSVIILNAFNAQNASEIPSQEAAEITKPESFGGGKIQFHSYLQSSFLNDKTDAIKKKEVIELSSPASIKNGKMIYDAGLTLSELANILSKVHGLKVQKEHAKRCDNRSINRFRKVLKENLSDNNQFVIVNFDGKVLGTKTGGHISPLAAYHEPSDSVLVLDVALHKNQWYFASVESLFKAMNTKDGNNFRGYLIVSEKKKSKFLGIF